MFKFGRERLFLSRRSLQRAITVCKSTIRNLKTCPELAKRVEWIANVVVPVVQRIERRFPKVKPAFLQQLTDVISSAQTLLFNRFE